MGNQVTYLTLVNRILWRADRQEATIPSSRMNDIVNSSMRDLYDQILSSYGDEYFATSTDIAVDTSTDTYDLPQNFYKIISMDATVAGRVINLVKYNPEERNLYQQFGIWDPYTPIRYRILGGTFQTVPQVRFIPNPSGDYTVSMRYVPSPPRLSQDDDFIDEQNGWADYIEVDGAIHLLDREETDTTMLRMERDRIVQRIMSMAPQRDLSRPDRVHDVELELSSPFIMGWP